MQSLATWGLVRTRPVGDTNAPEPPLLKRKLALRRWCSHASVSVTPWSFLMLSTGTRLNGHMPSSAHASPGSQKAHHAKTANAGRCARTTEANLTGMFRGSGEDGRKHAVDTGPIFRYQRESLRRWRRPAKVRCLRA